MTVLNLKKKSSVQNFKLLRHINEILQIIVTFLKFIISVRGSHCDYSPWAPPPQPKTKAYLRHCMHEHWTFSNMSPCRSVNSYGRFGGDFYLPLQGLSNLFRGLTMNRHTAVSQEPWFFISTSIRAIFLYSHYISVIVTIQGQRL
jgi:hypothetical protein